MASELIAEAITDYFGERCLDYAEGCPTCEAWAEYDRWNTRPAPAATDTELVTDVAHVDWKCGASTQGTAGCNDPADCDYPHCGCDPNYVAPVDRLDTVLHQFFEDGTWRTTLGPAFKEALGFETRELVTRSQAEELLAAERAEKEQAKYDLTRVLVHFVREHFPESTTFKPFDDLIGLITQFDNASTIAREYVSRIHVLEAKLAAVEQAARAAHETLIEINPSNYNHDDVCQLNDASVEAIFLLADILGETHGKTKEWWDERRAVLGGKPS